MHIPPRCGIGEPTLLPRRQPQGERGKSPSTWNLLGKAEAGPLAGRELKPLVYRAAQFWFSWAVFKPDTIIYQGK